MRKRTKIILFISVIAIIAVVAYAFLRPVNVLYDPSAVRDGYVVYTPGEVIDFSQTGNSRTFAPADGRWGGQEPKHRCITAKTAELKLFIPGGAGADFRFGIEASGVYDPEDGCQKITVFANDVQIADWCMARRSEYTAMIPANIMQDNHVNIRFEVAKPYVGETDIRTLGAAVRQIYLDKLVGQQTKRKISLWIQQKLWGGPVENPYNTNNPEPKQAK
ncbi:MAG: hypothetical protein IKB10_00310 [Alphaproteobacteria bacterium]|nr:hypothetical protein [Alphaproteobacteria bacterium]